KEMNDKRVETLQKRIQDLITDKRVAVAQIRMMQEEFEVNELSGIYFPLQRFGKFNAAVKDVATNELIAFSMFESNAEMQEWIRAKQAPGLSVIGGYELEYSQQVDGVSMGFMKDLIDKFGMTFNRDNKIQDDLYQLFLEHNPSLSMRKHMIHRKGVAGFDQDALRAYAHNMFHSSYQIAKTAHTHHMQGHLLAMQEEIKALPDTDDRVRATQVVNELSQRNDWILNPKGSEWAQKLTGFGFFWYLGTTPAAALVNVTQTAMVGLPVLGARYSYKAAGQALFDVSKAFMKGRGHVDKTLAGHELAAFRELELSGIIDKTMAHDMTGIADGGVSYSPRYHQVMKVSGFLFHHAERFNREVTAMASYRLAYAKKIQQYGAAGGLRAQQEAIQEAMDLTRLSHFDYANSNRPRFMQGDMARVLLLFRQHSVNMTYRLLRDFQQSFWGTGKDKEIARKQLAGMLGMTFLFAGAAGLPLYSLIAGIFNTLGGDEDEPFNFDDAVRDVLAEALGETAASVVMNGVPGTMTGADLTNRIGMNNLWFRDADASLEGEAAVGYYAEQALGPMYGILTGWGRAVELARDGHTGKAWEAATPKFARDWFKAVRYATDGVQTKRGDPILDEVSPWQIALQANGFSPLEISEQFRENNALSGQVRAIRDRRQLLLNRWALGKRLGDYELEYETLAEIERFNEVNPTVAIRSSDRVRSMKQRERISEQAVNGVIIPSKLKELVN
ncbi:MAG: PLxRFG domain-containing protein, partial [Pararheinheimera sp.]|nr:PLxRFG domain-containing protein [Rheinheimera sp.]